MTISIEAKQARKLIRTTIAETERLLDKTIGRGHPIRLDTLIAQVALNSGFPEGDVSETVQTYLHVRTDLQLLTHRFSYPDVQKKSLQP